MGLPELRWPGLYGASDTIGVTGEVIVSHGFLDREELSEVMACLPDKMLLVCVHLSGRIWVENQHGSTSYAAWGTPGTANLGLGGVDYAIRYRAETCQFARILVSETLFEQALGDDFRRGAVEFIDPRNAPAPGLVKVARRAVLLKDNLPTNRLLADSVGYAVAAELLHSWSNINRRKVPQLADARPQRARMKQVADYIEANLYSQFALSELSAVSGLSVPHFMRVFKVEFGMPPYRWIIERKIERSKALMRETSISITELSHLLEFSSLQHFSAAFRKSCGMSPSQYQATVRGHGGDRIV
ncbi:helix-turn-helix domain-containing protein [Erythrobacter sp. WG]|uniref:helix-turn-helix domain-containing protein n=1 Tax=Erythrobacter sp. WG TaxID=2985510 RepID=UPI002270153C|nr:AraC family transcriptional regulator [Erythrobacter sp. WG]MCX9147349.1 AraC family transcriptional regulator [Erythrobacter sp. WG]